MLRDYLLEEEHILSKISFSKGTTQIVATNQRVLRYEEREKEEFLLDLPYNAIASVGIRLRRITHYSLVAAGLVVIFLFGILLPSQTTLPSDLLLMVWVLGIILILVGILWKGDESSLEFRGKDIPDYDDDNPWILELEKISGDPEDVPDFVKTVHGQLRNRGVRN